MDRRALMAMIALFALSTALPFGAFAAECPGVLSGSLSKGATGSQVFTLQKMLNSDPRTRVASSGPGSPGQETSLFGALTFKAVVRFQELYAKDVLSPNGLAHGTGYVGPSTRSKLSSLCSGKSIAVPAPQSAQAAPSVPSVSAPTPVSVPVAAPVAAAVPQHNVPAQTVEWGAYTGNLESSIDAFESRVGKEMDLVGKFWSFLDGFPSDYASEVGKEGKTLVVYWESNFGYDEIINGSKDVLIKRFADEAKTYGYPIILAPWSEMNLSHSPWGYRAGEGTALKFKSSWKRMHGIFKAAGAANVKFAIHYNGNSVPDVQSNSFGEYYPGDEYVDYIGLSIFNFGDPWYGLSDLVGAAMKRLPTTGKPVYLLSMASAEGARKAEWIRELESLPADFPTIKGWVWFDQDKERDWRVSSDAGSLDAFKALPL